MSNTILEKEFIQKSIYVEELKAEEKKVTAIQKKIKNILMATDLKDNEFLIYKTIKKTELVEKPELKNFLLKNGRILIDNIHCFKLKKPVALKKILDKSEYPSIMEPISSCSFKAQTLTKKFKNDIPIEKFIDDETVSLEYRMYLAIKFIENKKKIIKKEEARMKEIFNELTKGETTPYTGEFLNFNEENKISYEISTESFEDYYETNKQDFVLFVKFLYENDFLDVHSILGLKTILQVEANISIDDYLEKKETNTLKIEINENFKKPSINDVKSDIDFF